MTIYSSSWVSERLSAVTQAAGVSMVYTYSQRLGSLTDVTFVSMPQSICTRTERCGPFQQAAPLENNIAEYLSGWPSQRSHVPSLCVCVWQGIECD